MMLFLVLGPAVVSHGALGLAAAQVLSFAAPALYMSRARTGGFEAVGLRGFPPQVLFGTTLIALSLWIWNVHWIAPIGAEWASSEQIAELESFFALPSRPLWQSLLVFALVPAICEELLHRGVLLPALCKRLGPRAGLAISALLFGLSHFNLARLLPTTVLGLVAGGLRMRSASLWPSMILHAGYNASLLISAGQHWAPPSLLAPIAAAVTLSGGLWIYRCTESQADFIS